MLNLKTAEKNGVTYLNVDFRDLSYGESVDVTILFDSPREFMSKFGTTKAFGLNYQGQKVSTLIPESFKSPDFNTNLGQLLSRFKKGDIVRVTKLAGRTKAGREFRYFNSIKVGVDSVVLNTTASRQISTTTAPANTNQSKNFSDINFDVKPKLSELNADEKNIVDGLKTLHPELNNEQRLVVLINNKVTESRAKQIVSEYF